jgi:RNA polymerase sigma-70 factor (ECF subfamily)
LLALIAEGQQAAIGTLYDRHGPAVLAYAVVRLENRHDAEEVVQDVFVTLWKRRSAMRLAGGSVLPWLLVTTRNLGANRARSRASATRRERRSAPSASAPDPVRSAELGELRATLTRAIAELPNTDRKLVEFCLADGLSYAEAARRTALTPGSVRNRLFRARTRLRQALDPVNGDIE